MVAERWLRRPVTTGYADRLRRLVMLAGYGDWLCWLVTTTGYADRLRRLVMLAGYDDWLRQLVTETGSGDDELKRMAWRQSKTGRYEMTKGRGDGIV